MIIKKISIKNFKMFKEEKTFELKSTSIIVGNNGVGKSTILEALNLALTGSYRGRNVLKILNQDLFNKEVVKEFLESLKSTDKIAPPSIEIVIYFDDFPNFKGTDTPDGSEADGFRFYIELDEDRNRETYESMVESGDLDSLPIELYRIRWHTFDRQTFFNAQLIDYKGLMIDSDNFSTNDFYTSRLIKEFFDEGASMKMSQVQRRVFDSVANDETVSQINREISEYDELKEKNVSLGVLSVSRTSWENLIATRVNGVPFEHIGKGDQCMIKTYLSFTRQSIKNKGIIMIEEPECHLSYGNLNKLLFFIRKKLSDFQVIITTHSSFVLNKLGLDNLLLISTQSSITFSSLSKDTVNFFERKAGFDTLRLLLCDKAILVEGDSDELILQRAYLDAYGKLPIENGIDIIAVGLSFLRFLEVSKQLKLNTVVVTDNDGNLEAVKKKYEEYLNEERILICYAQEVFLHEKEGISKGLVPNLNTLEPEILRANSLDKLNLILGTKFVSDEELLHFMINNKTDVAWKIFEAEEKIKYPKYIKKALGCNEE